MLAAYAVLAFAVLSTDVVSSGDIGVKFVQARALLDSGFRSLAMPNRASVLDPNEQFSPFRAPFVFATPDGRQAIFPPAAAVLQAPFVGVAGVAGMRLLAIIATGVVLWCASRLAQRGSMYVPILLGFGTPLWFYGVTESEHAIGVAFSTAAFAVAASGRPWPVRWQACSSPVARRSAMSAFCCCLHSLRRSGGRRIRWKAIAWTVATCVAVLLLAGAVRSVVVRPPAGGASAARRASRAPRASPDGHAEPRAPQLASMTLQERYDTIGRVLAARLHHDRPCFFCS